MNINVLDTNVLLTDSDALLAYPGDEIVIPEVVLSEIDKLKVGRSDPETRYRGRELSRVLFELADGKSLTEGIDLPENGRLRIAPFDSSLPMPEGFSAKNPDDRIIMTAKRLTDTRSEPVTLVTNDLNMLLKAQTLGIRIVRHDGGDNAGFARRFLVRPFQRYRTPILILVVAIALFAAAVSVALYTNHTAQSSSLPSEYRNFLSGPQADGIDALTTLQTKPDDAESLLTVAKLYYSCYNDEVSGGGDNAKAIGYAKKGITYYDRYLQIIPTDTDALVDRGTLEFFTGDTDRAIADIQTALEGTPDSLNGNYHMGIVLMQGRRDYDGAETYFTKTVELCGDDENNETIRNSAQQYLNQITLERENLSDPSSDAAVL